MNKLGFTHDSDEVITTDCSLIDAKSFKYEHKFEFKINLDPLCTVGVPFSHFVLAVMGAHPAPLAMLVIPVVDIVNPTVIRPFCGWYLIVKSLLNTF